MTKYRNRIPAQTGLTLVEVMIALSMFALLSLGSFRLLNSTANLVSQVNDTAQSVQKERRAMSIISSDLRHIAAIPYLLQTQDVSPAVVSDGGKTIEFSRTDNAQGLNSARRSTTRLRYQLTENDADGEMKLLREYLPNTKSEPQVVLTKVTDFQLRFLDARGSWHSRWPPEPAAERSKDELFREAEFVTPDGIEVSLSSSERSMRRLISLR